MVCWRKPVRLPEYRGDVLGGDPSPVAFGSILGKRRDGPARAPLVHVEVLASCGPHPRGVGKRDPRLDLRRRIPRRRPACSCAPSSKLSGTNTVRGSISRFAFAILVTEALLAATAVWQSGATSVTAQRLFWWREGDWYRARYIAEAAEPSRMSAYHQDVRIQVQNVGRATWHSERAPRVELAYRWESDGSPPSHDHTLEGRRTPLSQDVAPQELTTIAVRLAVPARPGTYVLRWDLVVDDGERFSNLGTPAAVQRVVVEPSTEARSLDRVQNW